MSKKSKRKTDLRSSILILLLIAILLIASTYAWFTANQIVTVSTLSVHVEAANGLQISTDATTWKSIIDNADIKTNAYSGNTNQVPENMEPVSTVGEIDSSTGYMKMYYGVVTADEKDGGKYKLTATQEATEGTTDANTKGKYIAFDLFLRVDKDTNLKMTTGSNVAAKENTTDKGLKQASRVAFCIQGTQPVGTALGTITGMKGATSFGTSGSTVHIWEPNSDLHTDAAIAHARDNYGINTSNGAAAVEYYGVKKDIGTGILLKTTNDGTDTTNFTKITPTYITKGEMVETNIFSLTAGITKIRVYMWIEGQDVDCENTASGTDISYNLQFQVVE